MNGAERRNRIIDILKSAGEPVNGTELARRLGVSRQVIVQDVALLRAENKNVLSTNKGYLLFQAAAFDGTCRRVFHVRHSNEQLLDELTTIVVLGGRVLDVSVEHELYGQICCDLVINNRQDAQDFAARLSLCRGNPLKTLTDDCHYHTVVAPSEALLDGIEAALEKKGYLVSA